MMIMVDEKLLGFYYQKQISHSHLSAPQGVANDTMHLLLDKILLQLTLLYVYTYVKSGHISFVMMEHYLPFFMASRLEKIKEKKSDRNKSRDLRGQTF